MLTQFPRPRLDSCHLRSRKALGHSQWSAQGNLQREFLLGALRRVWSGLKQLQPFGEEVDRFDIGTAPNGILSCLLQILNGPTIVPPLLKVHSQFCCPLACAITIGRLFSFADPLMETLPPLCCEPVV